MDGTLYDEVDFISQVYLPISCKIAIVATRSPEEIYSWMLSQWIEKGSSYNRIFEDVLSGINIDDNMKNMLISDCLACFRSFEPDIALSEWVESVLNEMRKNFGLFLVSDGSGQLQTKKFESLDLGRWIDHINLGITGKFGADFYKPSIKIIDEIDILRRKSYKGRVVYFGDRNVDAVFSSQAGFDFVCVKCMKKISE